LHSSLLTSPVLRLQTCIIMPHLKIVQLTSERITHRVIFLTHQSLISSHTLYYILE
jgi:hypothetical protein